MLLDTIEEGDRGTGSSIVEVIAGMGAKAAPEITSRLKSTTNINTRLLYVQMCELLHITEALGSILPLLRNPDKESRVAAAKALRQIGDASAVESLILEVNDESGEVSAEAAKSLGSLGDKQALGKLKQILSDGDWQVRYNAANALYEIVEEGIEVLRKTSRCGEGQDVSWQHRFWWKELWECKDQCRATNF